ncbi:MAG: XTP/dITP diphosphatase [Magnetococcales bacterium]|nr:XTP/dITP diphosphatase [Magnetococcales bacterium]
MKIVLATRNQKKVEEIGRVLQDASIELLSLTDFPDCPEVVEDGETFQANAEKKAREVAAFTGCHALADDSGLVVDSLQGAPGVYSARYAGADATDQANLEKVLAALGKTPASQRGARFQCVISFASPGGEVESFFGCVEGRINQTPQGNNGFGYDPVFVPQGGEVTFAEMTAQQKDALSHRGRALAAFAAGYSKPALHISSS